jgi:hypothetical protein
MAGPVLYSTNPFISFDIGCKYRGNKHVVWCSEVFDPTTQATLTAGSMVAPTSSPLAIARALAAEVRNEERHSTNFKRFKQTFKRLATSWEADGSITAAQASEIRSMVTQQSYRIWRPLVFVIPRANIEASGRLINVEPTKRAGHGPEYRIFDLDTAEFDVLECF